MLTDLSVAWWTPLIIAASMWIAIPARRRRSQAEARRASCTDELRSADALRADAERRLALLSTMQPDLLWQTDSGLRVRYVSMAFREMTGRHPRSVLGRSVIDCFELVAGRTSRARRLSELLKRGNAIRGLRVAWRTRWGALRVGAIDARPMHDAEGRLLGYRGVLADVTECSVRQRRRRAEPALTPARVTSASVGNTQVNKPGWVGTVRPPVGPARRPATGRRR